MSSKTGIHGPAVSWLALNFWRVTTLTNPSYAQIVQVTTKMKEATEIVVNGEQGLNLAHKSVPANRPPVSLPSASDWQRIRFTEVFLTIFRSRTIGE